MKKILLAFFAALTLGFVGCQKDADDSREPGPDVDKNLLVGTWEVDAGDYVNTYTFNENFTFTQSINDAWEINGTYSLSGDILTLTMDSTIYTMRIVMMYQNNVMALCYKTGEEGWGIVDGFELLYRQGVSINTPIDDIQGKWWWYLLGDESIIRSALTISGNSFEFIIPAWREFMTGNIEYKSGKIIFHVEQFKTRDDSYSKLAEHLYEGWHVPGPDDYHQEPTFGWEFTQPFVANGNEAFSILANLPAYYVKQQ